MEFSHIDANGAPQMVDVSSKKVTVRAAKARGVLNLGFSIMSKLENGEFSTRKGPVFCTAIVAATLAVKKTYEFIPFCHQLMLSHISIEIKPFDDERIEIFCTVKCEGQTGVEMEALTGVHIAALTVHDMCKAVSPDICVEFVGLVEKSGGKTLYKRKGL